MITDTGYISNFLKELFRERTGFKKGSALKFGKIGVFSNFFSDAFLLMEFVLFRRLFLMIKL